MGVSATAVAKPFDTSSLVADRPPFAVAGAVDDGTPWPTGMGATAIDPRDNAAYVAVNRLLAAGYARRSGRARRSARGTDADASRRRGSCSRPTRAGTGAPPPKTTPTEATRGARRGNSGSSQRRCSARAARDAGAGRFAPPRIGLYKSWVANIDEGWTRWLFERYEFPYTSLANRDIRAGGLRARFDVDRAARPVAARDPRGPPARPIVRPRPQPWNPPPPEYQGGIGDAGVEALKAFVRDGGTLVALDEASDLVLARFGGRVPRIVRDVTEGLPQTRVLLSRLGAADRRWTRRSPARSAWRRGARPRTSQLARVRDRPTRRPAASRATRPPGRLLMSGWLLGAETIANRHAALDVPLRGGPRRAVRVPSAVPRPAARDVQAAVQCALRAVGSW